MFEVAKNPCYALVISSLSDEVQLKIPFILGFANTCTHTGCGALLLLMLVVRFVVSREMIFKPRNADSGVSLGC